MSEKIARIMDEAASRGTGLLGLGFCDLNTGREHYVNGDALFPTASVYKIFLLCELERRLGEGLIDPDEKIVLLDSEKTVGSGRLRYEPEGSVYTLSEYIDLMMQISDNTATDWLYRLIGKEAVYANVIRPLGLEKTRIELDCRGLISNYFSDRKGTYTFPDGVERGIYRNSPFYACTAENNNVTTPREMLLTLKALYEGRVIGPETDQKILDIMAACQTNSRIPALLPPGTRIAHKTGTLDHAANDAGIVYTPAGNYILTCFYNGNLADENEYLGTAGSEKGTTLLAELSLKIYEAFTEDGR